MSTCLHCKRPMRRSHTFAPGTVAHGGHGLCSTCAERYRTYGTLDGWQPADRPGHKLDPGLVNARLNTYTELRGRGLTRRECAERMDISYACLEKLLLRHKSDPRSDSRDKADVVAEWARNRAGWDGPRTVDADQETIRSAALTVCEHCPDDARMLLAMLGLVAA